VTPTPCPPQSQSVPGLPAGQSFSYTITNSGMGDITVTWAPTFVSNGSRKVDIQILDSFGNVVAGPDKSPLTAASLAAGTYTVVLRNTGAVATSSSTASYTFRC
jgi:hypothetical protein